MFRHKPPQDVEFLRSGSKRVCQTDTALLLPQCQLRLAGFHEEITLHVEWDGLIVGLDYKAPVGPLASTRDCTKMPVRVGLFFFFHNAVNGNMRREGYTLPK